MDLKRKGLPVKRFTLCLTLAVASPVLVGCSLASPLSTTANYTPADGVAGEVQGGIVKLRNMLVIPNKDESAGTLAGVLSNTTADELEVAFTDGTHSQKFTVPAQSTLKIEPGTDNTMQFDALGARAGELLPMEITVNGAFTRLAVPVVNQELPRYSTASITTPSSSTSSSTTATATPSESASEGASSTESSSPSSTESSTSEPSETETSETTTSTSSPSESS